MHMLYMPCHNEMLSMNLTKKCTRTRVQYIKQFPSLQIAPQPSSMLSRYKMGAIGLCETKRYLMVRLEVEK
jgi:hypothetical protein